MVQMRFQAACLLRCPQTGQPVTLDDFTANMPRGNNVSILLTLIAAPQRQPENAPTMFQAAYWCDVVNQIGSLKKQNRLVFSHAIFYWIDWVSGCLTLLNCLMLLLPPLFDATTPSPTSSRTEHSFFGNKRALVRRRAKRG